MLINIEKKEDGVNINLVVGNLNKLIKGRNYLMKVGKSVCLSVMVMAICVFMWPVTVMGYGDLGYDQGTVIFDFDDGVIPEGFSRHDPDERLTIEISDENSIPGVEGHSVKISISGGGTMGAWWTTEEGVEIPEPDEGEVRWVFYHFKVLEANPPERESDTFWMDFRSKSIMGTMFHRWRAINILNVDTETPYYEQGGMKILELEDGWYRVLLHWSDESYLNKWGHPRAPYWEWPLIKVGVRFVNPTEGSVILLDHFGYI